MQACESLGETRNCVETLALRARVPTQFLVSPKLSRVFLLLFSINFQVTIDFSAF